MSTGVVAAPLISDVVYVLAINTEDTNGILYTPTGVCGETSTLNNGG